MLKIIFLILLSSFAKAEFPENLKGLTATFGYLTPGLDLEASSRNTVSDNLRFAPATQGKTILSLHYGDYSLSLSTFNPSTSSYRQKYGHGQAEDYKFEFLLFGMNAEVFYQKYKSYYLENASGGLMANPFGPNGEYPQFSGLKVERASFQLFHFLKPENFNFKRAFTFTERPTISGGSWFLSSALDWSSIRTSGSLVPPTALENHGDLSDLRASTASSITVGAGGAYSYVYKGKWVASVMLGYGASGQQVENDYLTKTEAGSLMSHKIVSKVALGYSGEKYLVVFYYDADATTIQTESSELLARSRQSKLVAGWRF